MHNSKSTKVNEPNKGLIISVLTGQMGDFSVSFSQGKEVWSEKDVDYVLIGPESVTLHFRIFGQPHHAIVSKSDYLDAIRRLTS